MAVFSKRIIGFSLRIKLHALLFTNYFSVFVGVENQESGDYFSLDEQKDQHTDT
jgi:hypothetical protein